MKALIGVAGPAAAWWATQNMYESSLEYEERYPEGPAEPEPEEEEDEESGRWWLIGTAVAIVLLVLFASGALGVRPFIVEGISMEPAYERGDVAVIRDGGFDGLDVNDVIKFQQGGLTVVHRVIEIPDDGTVITQGRQRRPTRPAGF